MIIVSRVRADARSVSSRRSARGPSRPLVGRRATKIRGGQISARARATRCFLADREFPLAAAQEIFVQLDQVEHAGDRFAWKAVEAVAQARGQLQVLAHGQPEQGRFLKNHPDMAAQGLHVPLPVTSAPSISNSPPVGSSSRSISRSSVDLPRARRADQVHGFARFDAESRPGPAEPAPRYSCGWRGSIRGRQQRRTLKREWEVLDMGA